MKKLLTVLILAILALIPALAQSAAYLTPIIQKQETNIMDFAYLVTSETGMVCTPFEAYTYCDHFDTFPLNTTAGSPITPRIISHFFMSNYGLKGGIMWSYTGSARYAWKEMCSRGFWPAGTDPDSIISGRDLIRIVTAFFETWPDARMYVPNIVKANPANREYLLKGKEGAK